MRDQSEVVRDRIERESDVHRSEAVRDRIDRESDVQR